MFYSKVSRAGNAWAMSFQLPDMATLRKALDHLKKHDVDLEVPSDEIGPEAPGSPHMGFWFHDLDGYRGVVSARGKVI